MFLLGFPLLLVPFAIYNMIAFLTPGVDWTSPVGTVHMMSGQDWVLTWEDVLLAFAIFLLWVEIVKSTRLGTRSIMDHILAMVLFIVMLVEFPGAAGGDLDVLFAHRDRPGRRAGRLHRRHARCATPDRNRRRGSSLTGLGSVPGRT